MDYIKNLESEKNKTAPDEELTKEGLDTKIMGLSYVELLWPPIKERLKNPDRFGIMFCPITRSCAVSYKMEDPYNRDLMLPKFERNNIDWAMSAAENFAFLLCVKYKK